MGNSQPSLFDIVIKEIVDESSSGYITYKSVKGNSFHLEYSHPNFHVLVKKIQKNHAYRFSCIVKLSGFLGDFKTNYIQNVTDVPSDKFTGTIVDYIHDRCDKKKDDPYAEVILEQRPLKISGYNYYAVLLIEKDRIPFLKTGVPYEFKVSLFRGENEFLISDVNCVKLNVSGEGNTK